jgi:peptidoglycan/LPS O-acetylase OafA/YrhL
MLLVVLAFPFDISAGPVPLWDLASVWVMLPIIVMLGIGQRQRNRFGALLGDLSYPIYVLHYPVLLIASGLHQSALSQVDIDVMSLVTYGTVVVLSLVALKFYDEPVRRALAGGKPSARARKTSEPPTWPGAAGWGDAGAPYFTRPLWSG